MRKDKYDRIIDHLESLAPLSKGKLCANRTCSFYVSSLVAEAKKWRIPIPAHSCLGLVGPTGPRDDLNKLYKQARIEEAERLLGTYPELFMTFQCQLSARPKP